MSDKKKLKNLGIIPDGNRRWSRKRGLPTLSGHKKGAKKIKETVSWCRKLDIQKLTIYGFSTENWKRSAEEINYLMDIFFELGSDRYLKKLKEEGVKVRVVGEESKKIPEKTKKSFDKLERETENLSDFILNIAFNYGGRREIVRAVQKINDKDCRITEENIRKNLYVKNYPDLIIRTGKEKRLSNFLLWQSAYSELYFSESFWPDFSENEFKKIINNYENRSRRFGK